jgi:hypothetical protein
VTTTRVDPGATAWSWVQPQVNTSRWRVDLDELAGRLYAVAHADPVGAAGYRLQRDVAAIHWV